MLFRSGNIPRTAENSLRGDRTAEWIWEDLGKALQDLYAEKGQIERIIVSLEELQASTTTARHTGKRRGRKSMGAAERAEVSLRMKQYWAARRRR